MTISTNNYHKKIFEHTNLSKIIGVLIYDALHILHNEIQFNAISVQSNIRGGQRGHCGLVVSPTAYALLINNRFFVKYIQ